MSSFSDYVQKVRQEYTRRSYSCIPGIVQNDAFEYAKKLFKSLISSNRDITKISIIDPYFIPMDLYTVTELFGGFRHISLEVISKFRSTEDDRCSKEEGQKTLKDRAKQICDNGLFADITFLQSAEKMHDRYFIFWHDNIVKFVICVGGSIAQRFDDYIFISEILDKYLEKCIIKYYGLLTDNSLNRF